MTQFNAEELRRIFHSAPFVADLGIEAVSLTPGECSATLTLAPRHLQQHGYVHAGVQATLADHCCGAAAWSLAGPGKSVLSIEFKINMLRPARGERLLCRARVLKAGRQVSVVEADVHCLAGGEERLVSKMTATMAVVEAAADSQEKVS